MGIAFRTFAAEGITALFDEPNTTGDVHDIDAPRNAPAKYPEANLDKVYFHSDLDYLEVLADSTTVINHSSVAGTTTGGVDNNTGQGQGTNDLDSAVLYNASSTTHLLYTHGQAYLPRVAVIVDDQVLFPGMPVQSASDGRARYCSAYMTSTELRLHEWTSVGTTTLSAVSKTYRFLVFRDMRDPDPAIDEAFKFTAADGIVSMAHDRFNSARAYLQVVPGGSPFALSYGKQMDLANGAPRFVNPDGSVFETVPATARGRMTVRYPRGGSVVTLNLSYGAYMNYSGSFAGGTQILVQAP